MPTPADRLLNVELTMRAIDPRNDQKFVLQCVTEFLDACDPDERPAIQLTRWPT